MKSDFLAGLGFGATQMLGENTGIYIGYSVDTGRNVYLQPSLASQGIKGTVTNALASAFVGSLGGGKSFCNNLLVYYSVLFGGQAVILDPKSERGNWKETLPEIAHEINIVNLTSDKDNAGLLDPFVIMKNVKDAESLAIDILTFLTGISSRDGEKFPVLRKAVRSVTQSDSRGLLHVIDELRREDTPISRNIADHIDLSLIHIFTTDKNGNTDVAEVTAGTVYIKELSAPAGYKVDKTVYPLTIKAGETAILKVSDTPKVTDTLIELFKIDMETQKDNPQGNASLALSLIHI